MKLAEQNESKEKNKYINSITFVMILFTYYLERNAHKGRQF